MINDQHQEKCKGKPHRSSGTAARALKANSSGSSFRRPCKGRPPGVQQTERCATSTSSQNILVIRILQLNPFFPLIFHYIYSTARSHSNLLQSHYCQEKVPFSQTSHLVLHEATDPPPFAPSSPPRRPAAAPSAAPAAARPRRPRPRSADGAGHGASRCC